MATHDYVIDNSTGANVRADINNVLQAILTNNSSSSSPSTTAAYMFWADTTSGTLKIRNSSNNAWIELLQLDGTLTLEDGSASTPALAFRDDLNTGIYSSAADKFNVATGGVERMELGSQTVFNEDGADVDFRIEGDTDENLFRIDAGNDRVGIGTSSPSGKLDIVTGSSGGKVLIDAESSSAYHAKVVNDSGDLTLGSRSASADTKLTTQRTLIFNSGSSETERMRIDSNGELLIGTSSTSGIASSANDLVVSKSGNMGITIQSTDSSYSNLFYADSAGSSQGYVSYQHSTDSLQIATANSERMRIDSSGRLLIGTTSSTTTDSNAHSRLQIVTTAGPNVFFGRNDSDTADDSRLGVINFGANHGGTYHEIVTIRAAADAQHASNSKASRLELYTTASGNTQATERMRIDSQGKVGIGTTPDAGTKLHLHQTDATAGNNLKIENNYSSNGTTNLLIASRQGDAVMATLSYVDASLAIRFGTATNHPLLIMTGGAERARVTSGGVITVGGTDTSPAAAGVQGIALDGVNGYFAVHRSNTESFGFGRGGTGLLGRFFTDGTAVGNITVGSSSTAYNSGTSDRTLKKNFEVWNEDVLSIFKNLNPQKFNFTKEDDGVQKTKGFIAQDLVEHFPEAYPKDETTDKYWFNPSGMVVYLMKAIQELEAKVASLEAA